MRVLIFGNSGQVSRELARLSWPEDIDVVQLGRDACDFSQPTSIAAALEPIGPDFVINAAAYTAVDRAESEPELAMTVNGEAPKEIARLCERIGAALVHIRPTTFSMDAKRLRTGKTTRSVHFPFMAVPKRRERRYSQPVGATPDRSNVLGICRPRRQFCKNNVAARCRTARASRCGGPAWRADVRTRYCTGLEGNGPCASGGPRRLGNLSLHEQGAHNLVRFCQSGHRRGRPRAVSQDFPVTTPEYPTPPSAPSILFLIAPDPAGVRDFPALVARRPFPSARRG